MRKLLPLLLLLGCSNDRLVPVTECGRPCRPEWGASLNKGVCHDGTIHCDEDGNKTCLDYVGPSAEICDGLDNDCDGKTDEVIQSCSTVCGNGTQACGNGVWGACNAPKPSVEVCDGIDNDCDGKIDEPEDLPVAFCYTGAPGTSNNGVCHPGSVRCIGGQEVCANQQLPSVEVCDGLDNDCDGVVDNGNVQTDLDLVIVFDNSGSMYTSAFTVKAAARSWVTKYAGIASRRYALVTAPDDDYAAWGENPRLYQDFTDAATFSNAMAAQSGQLGSGFEPTLDALADLFSSSNPLHLSWRKGAKAAIIVFSDEEPQSFWAPYLSTADMVTIVSGRGITVNAFTDRSTANVAAQWDQISVASGGFPGWNIHGTAAQIEADLDQIITMESCTP